MSPRTSPLAISLLIAACNNDPSACDSGCDTAASEDTAPTYDGEVSLQEIAWSCDDDGYDFAFYTAGWSVAGALQIGRAGAAWIETHPVPVTDADPSGYWTALALSLVSTGGELSAVVEGERTAFECAADGAVNQFQIDVYDATGGYATCALFGADSAGDTGALDTASDTAADTEGGGSGGSALDCETAWQ